MKNEMGPTRTIEVDGIRTRYFDAGVGKPLVLIHGGQYGLLYSAYSWSSVFRILSTRFRVIAFDRLGMGFTDNPKG